MIGVSEKLPPDEDDEDQSDGADGRILSKEGIPIQVPCTSSIFFGFSAERG
jgi:hypothetical protein